jgi:hypothetical protein
MMTSAALKFGIVPLLVGGAILHLYGARSGWEAFAFILLSISLVYWVMVSLKRGTNAVHDAVEATEAVHHFSSHAFRVFVDDKGNIWLRAGDIKRYLQHEHSHSLLCRRFPMRYRQINPALDAWYVHAGIVKDLVGRSHNEADYRFLNWVTQTLPGLQRFDRSMGGRVPAKARHAKFNNWLVRHWRGEVGLFSAILLGGLLAGGAVWITSVFEPKGDITLHYREAAKWALVQVILLAVGLYWWGRGVMMAAQRWIASDRSVLVALVAMGLGFAGVEFGLSQVVDMERQYLITEWYPIVTDRDPKAEVTFDPKSRRILLKGQLGFGTTNRLRAVLAENPGATGIELHSPGGRVAEGIAAQKVVWEHRLDTYVRRGCASACISIYLGGRNRYITPNGRMGLHRSGHHWKADDGKMSPTDEAEAKYMRRLGIEEGFIQRSLAPSIHGLYEPTAAEVLAAGLATTEWRP